MIFFQSSMIGAAILAVIYFALVTLGWLHFPILVNKPPQEMLGIIAMESLGPIAAPCVCLAIMFACVTTAIVLAYLFAELLRRDITRDKISHSQALMITLGIGFLVSNLEFSGIAQFLGPILEVVYPALIALTLFNIGHKYWKSYSLVPGTKVNEEQDSSHA
jgi:LIVCS family branched-chain amino acid:cation transporter